MHAHLDRTGLESIVFSETSAVATWEKKSHNLQDCVSWSPFALAQVHFENFQNYTCTRSQHSAGKSFEDVLPTEVEHVLPSTWKCRAYNFHLIQQLGSWLHLLLVDDVFWLDSSMLYALC